MARRRSPATLLERAARVAYAFLMMNYAAVDALFTLVTRKKVWR
jgi:hypothetical protein